MIRTISEEKEGQNMSAQKIGETQKQEIRDMTSRQCVDWQINDEVFGCNTSFSPVWFPIGGLNS